jgi:trans-2,3-dihydro-3-hydroxyanthranilate isomerase
MRGGDRAGTLASMTTVHVVRVFTRGDRGGNHLGIVTSVDDLTRSSMQAIATGLAYSETIFVDIPDRTARIFTPAEELPFAGHPLVGAAAHLAEHHGLAQGTLITGAGSIRYQASAWRASIETHIEALPIDPDDVAAVATSAGLPEPIATTRLGLPKEYLIAEYADFDVISALSPRMEALVGRFGFLVYARTDDHVKARFFAPGTGVQEDAATGSAAVALAHAYRSRGEVMGNLTIHQGDEIGHPSTIELEWTGTHVTIGGTVRSEGATTIP